MGKKQDWGRPRHSVPVEESVFVTPQNIGEALARIDMLTHEVLDIQVQIGDPSKFADTLGEAMDWRRRAIAAMNWKNSEKRMLREWAKKQRANTAHILSRNLGVSDPNSPDELLAAAFALLKQLQADEVELDPQEVGLIQMIGCYLGVFHDPAPTSGAVGSRK